MISEEGQGRGKLVGGLGPLFSGLIAGTLIAMTLLVAVVLGLGDQALIAWVEPTATETAAPPAVDVNPSATSTPEPSTATPLTTALADSTSDASPVPSPTVTPSFTPTKTRVPSSSTPRCVPPNGFNWNDTYRVKRGDTLSGIAAATGTTVAKLRLANCIGLYDQLYAGQRIYVPRPVVPPPTYTPRPTPVPTVPPPVIETFTLDPAKQVIVGECVQIEWVIEGEVALITLLGDTEVLVSNAPATGSHSDCPTEIGTRTYTLRAVGPDASSQQTRSILVVDDSVPPTANFAGSPTSGEEPLEVSFTANCTGIITSYAWSFGDGGSSAAANPSHTYATAGDYTVSLTVTGPGGSDTETKTNYIRVSEPAPPVAAFSGSPTSGEEPLTVKFTDGSTGAITSWSWSFGDGGTSAVENPSHTYAAAGSYTVSLTVTGPGGSDTETKTNYITVAEPAPPVAVFSGSPTSGPSPLTVSFTNSSTGAVTSYAWSFGDGGSSAAENPSHTYAAAGSYTVSLTVTGPGGSDTETKTGYISVSEPPPPPPVAAFSGSPTSGESPLTVNFTDSSTGAITSWSWSFGDGGTSAAENPSHTYVAAGSYTVSLTVTGPGGSDTATRTNYISVSEPPSPPPVAAFSGNPTSGEAPLEVRFTNQSTGAVTSRLWNFGDGGTSTAPNPTHTYAAAGDYTVSLTVTGPGGSDTATRVNYIHVTEPATEAARPHGEPSLLVYTLEPAAAALPQVQEWLLAT